MLISTLTVVKFENWRGEERALYLPMSKEEVRKATIYVGEEVRRSRHAQDSIVPLTKMVRVMWGLTLRDAKEFVEACEDNASLITKALY